MEDKFKGLYRIDSSRFKSWDYSSSGLYFVTICTKNRIKYFGEILETQGIVSLHPLEIGKVAIDNWLSIPTFHPYVYLDQFTLMPNHLHGILGIDKSDDYTWNSNTFGPQSRNLASIIRGFKSSVTTFARINNIEFDWQSKYYDRVVRSKEELDNIRQYIFKNPESWLSDPDYRE